jgi:hypothetical protein
MADVGLQTQRELARWYALKEHAVQRAYLNSTARFNVIPAGRRSGKTERFKRKLAKLAMRMPGEDYFIAAPTRDQVKKIYWNDMKRLTFQSMQSKPPSETELIITLDIDTRIHLIGLDRPERMEGQFWSGGGIDEIGNVKDDAWELNIKPALDTFNPTRPDYRAWCDLLGVPEGAGTKYHELWDYSQTRGVGTNPNAEGYDPDWAGFTWHSADILPPDLIASAMRTMSKKQFAQEYEASFETTAGRIYDDYGPRNHTSEVIAAHEQLWWCHDFNFTPMSSTIGVRRIEKNGAKRDCILFLDEIILTSAIARQSAMEFVDKYKAHKNRHVIVFGDPAGRAGEKHGHASDYTEIEAVLLSNGWTFERRVKSAAPAIRDRQNAVRAKIANAAGAVSLFVNPGKAPYTHKGLSTVQTKKGSSFLEEESDFQHVTTAVGYCVDYVWPVGGAMFKLGIAGN